MSAPYAHNRGTAKKLWVVSANGKRGITPYGITYACNLNLCGTMIDIELGKKTTLTLLIRPDESRYCTGQCLWLTCMSNVIPQIPWGATCLECCILEQVVRVWDMLTNKGRARKLWLFAVSVKHWGASCLECCVLEHSGVCECGIRSQQGQGQEALGCFEW